MKEIGEKLSKKRIESGVSLNEAAEDLNYNVSQLEAIEQGNFKNFKDIFILKCIVGDYAKYLGFDSDEIIDEFNDYVFESTSKIPLDDIQKASKIKEKNQDDKIISPYTMTEKKNNTVIIVLISIIVVLVLTAVAIFYYNSTITNNRESSNLKVSYLKE